MECNFENCGYYTDGECNICGMGTSGEDTFCRLCKDNPKCYYKQNAELKAENERLKEKIESYVCSQNCYAYKQADNYRQTLQKIKTIAKKTIDIYYPDYYDEGFEEDIVTEFAEKILDLITKVEEE